MSLFNSLVPPKKSLLIAIIALSITLLLRVFSGASFIESWYSRGVFSAFRTVWDHSIALSPLPLYYLFWVLVVILLVRGLRKSWQQKGWSARLLTAGRKLLIFTAWLAVLFMWMWGFNYGRQSVEEKIHFTTYSMDFDELTQSVTEGAFKLQELRNRIAGQDSSAIETDYSAREWEKMIRPLVVKAFEKHGYPTAGKPRGRMLQPKGMMLRFSTAGVYWPWVAESNVDAGNHPLSKGPILAHELAHAYGFGEEGSCSFWSWLSGTYAEDPFLQYAFELHYWRDLARKWLVTDREGYTEFYRTQLAPGIRQDIISIIQNQRKYPDFLPAARDLAYDTYLKTQGIKDGLLSYGRVVQLVEGYKRSYE